MVSDDRKVAAASTQAERCSVGICTYFDQGYLTRAVALYRSLSQYHPDLHWFMFCMDNESLQAIQSLRLPGVTVVSRSQLEVADPELAAAAADRSAVEYYFTCTAAVMLQSLAADSAISTLFYADADLCFFAPLDSLLQDMQQAAIYITEHRFPSHLQDLLIYGRFNVGIIGVRRSAQAIRCLSVWRRQCIEWCFDRLEGERFGDQKYLDRWPAEYSELQICQHPGVNAAPWNKDNSQYQLADGQVQVNGQPLVCFHFQGLRLFPGGLVLPQAIDYGSLLPQLLQDLVYRPYLRRLRAAETECRMSASSRRYSVSPRLLTIYRSRGNGRYWVRLAGQFLGLTRWNALLLVAVVAVRRILGK